MLCILLAALDQTVVIPAVPAIAGDLGGYEQLSWIVAAYLIASTISTPIYGKLSDTYGRRRLLTTCIALFIATSALCALAQSIDQLIWFRALQGLGGGGLMALAQAAIADVAPPRERGRYQGYLSAVWALASISGPLVGGLVAEQWSWRWIFWINLPLGAVAMWVCNNGLKHISVVTLPGKPRIDLLGMLLLAGAISSLLLGLSWGGNEYAWTSYQILGMVVMGCVLIGLLRWQERRASDPVLPPSAFASPSYVSSVIVSTLAAVVLFVCLFSIPLYFQLVRGATAATSGLYVAPFMLANVCGNVLGGMYARRYGAIRGALRMGSAASCVGLVLMAALPLDAPVWMRVAAMVITAPGIGICLLGTIMSAQNAVATKDIGAATGGLLVLRSVGGAGGSTLAGAIIASGLGIAHGTLEHGRSALQGLSETSQLATNFELVYGIAALVCAIVFIVALRMPDTPLRRAPHCVVSSSTWGPFKASAQTNLPRFKRRAASQTPMPSWTSTFIRLARHRLAKQYA
ncbi:Multidrug resistance protein 3 [Achromobacter veterisilvae]|uniref:Multidrug resistance protein 3 n=1 Tax=Achromobacter veterisilvae TaxID=2069367 RepID=A0A446CSX7_9BURK|nr:MULTISPECIES: MDR family MFS transporter [Burkholderiales]SSW70943.1 Multidrug resistance protein 3 [Achromobacter veterisilvae]